MRASSVLHLPAKHHGQELVFARPWHRLFELVQNRPLQPLCLGREWHRISFGCPSRGAGGSQPSRASIADSFDQALPSFNFEVRLRDILKNLIFDLPVRLFY